LGLKNFPVDKSSVYKNGLDDEEETGLLNHDSMDQKNAMMILDGVYLNDGDMGVNNLNINRLE
jgi:hypothetical protein